MRRARVERETIKKPEGGQWMCNYCSFKGDSSVVVFDHMKKEHPDKIKKGLTERRKELVR